MPQTVARLLAEKTPLLGTNHPAIQEAEAAREAGQERVILFNLSGHGSFDLTAYQAYFEGKLQDYDYPEEEIRRAISSLPKVVMPA